MDIKYITEKFLTDGVVHVDLLYHMWHMVPPDIRREYIEDYPYHYIGFRKEIGWYIAEITPGHGRVIVNVKPDDLGLEHP